ncbi:bifunctional methylenetetrahydrofolate dehydrogenase/methenyltetrahydrofolate cyclohydrolase FolD [Acidithiobacillus caldus]|uniref:Bifunctional protein FolD n=1 Tax=Acidithiobacillus caldus (strain ATCC 51756 / DSM 8584 / KU) TaxID=637389 RepID=A0A059ZVM3_ACICK|nr:bifunctional methylenetetrahydrofolate dehydrogenase/methenyltetrahydrofolate cyclohydrolase FolD [Acidithiobacillus caldus]AIA56764.1 Methylenetetrahydrofolate dehydrogenase (NADP+) / Methenyltetrahydrofolate cyclohydrolase [Acidithiobacillus caldus ATCC 51756]MBU2731134.1 bifunctional methylenetetrahydrofolate dehydrogenase/methenyltetrahydrofolate cyclohydrolase FolD [Acidithiobacillus caldus]MBU2735981.1 bifunctional methylenetetrahydrofolate dehydrogenase/methenyltetrahydrofolate cyclohy
MTANILDGKSLARSIINDLSRRVSQLTFHKLTPALAVILIGDDPASALYVKNKANACDQCGIKNIIYRYNNNVSQQQIINDIYMLNDDPTIHGILVQLPLPKHIDIPHIIESISPRKDVDGFHPYNVGRLAVGSPTHLLPCTPKGVINLLKYNHISLSGANVVVIGASNIVGKPLSNMLINEGATVSICHKLTTNLSDHTRNADILISATGHAGLICSEMVKRAAVVVDVGISRNADGRIIGDVDYENVRKIASWITPVPGGVGPMTIAMLLENTVCAAERLLNISSA